MAKKTNFLGPKKRGRPATGRDQVVKVGLPAPFLQRIDRWAGGFHDMDRSAALRCLLNIGLSRSRSKAAVVFDLKGHKAHHSKRKDAIPKVPVSEKTRTTPRAHQEGSLVMTSDTKTDLRNIVQAIIEARKGEERLEPAWLAREQR